MDPERRIQRRGNDRREEDNRFLEKSPETTPEERAVVVREGLDRPREVGRRAGEAGANQLLRERAWRQGRLLAFWPPRLGRPFRPQKAPLQRQDEPVSLLSSLPLSRIPVAGGGHRVRVFTVVPQPAFFRWEFS